MGGGEYMKHIKTYHSQTIETDAGQIIVEGPLDAAILRNYQFHEQLTTFRPASRQFAALTKIVDFPEGRIIIARKDNTIIGYVTFLYPDPMERWSTYKMDELIVLGAIEVSNNFRGLKIAASLLQIAMMDNYMENYIIISTEYYWHWDMDGTKLSVWQYRKMMENMMAKGGLAPFPTDDSEIISHPANCLMVRIGKNVTKDRIEQFDRLRFLRRHQYRKIRGDF